MSSPAPSSPWARSVPTVRTALGLVADHYVIEASDATLVRSFTNDVYRIDTTGDDVYALKVYGAHRWSADEVRWEHQLGRELAAAGLAVADGVVTRTGDPVGTLEAPEGLRPFALTRWVPGDKPQPPWSESLYRSFGTALAGLHTAADSFESSYPRRPVRRGDEPERVIAVLDPGSSRRRLVQRAARTATEELTRLAGHGLRWGVRHGDASLDNLHVEEDGTIHLYDLDLAGPGWQVEDLAGATSTEYAVPFLEGYVHRRPLPEVELDALTWLRILAHIDNLAFHLLDKPAAMGSATLTEGWVDRGFDGLADAVRDAGC